MKSYLVPGIIGAAVIALATLLYAIILPDAPIEDISSAPENAQIVAPAADNNQTIVTNKEAPAAQDAAEEDPYKLVIDIARVQADGMAVFAGRGAPNGSIFITENGQIFAQNTIDEQGQWVVLPETALSPGAHLLQLEMVTKDGTRQRADVSLVVEIAEGADEKPLVALVPQTDEQSPTLLQSPDEDLATSTASDAPKASGAKETASADGADDEADAAPLTQAEQVAEILGQREVFIQIGSLSYGDDKGLRVHGVASGGVTVTGKMADEALVKVALQSNGRWSSRITGAPFATGDRQSLEIYLQDDEGTILAQTKLNVSQSQLSAGLDGSLMVVVHKGDALWRIAYRSYGEGVRYVDIFRRNADKIDDPDLIYPNQIFAVPGVTSE
jgi:nucleoid-associated protein YgaU